MTSLYDLLVETWGFASFLHALHVTGLDATLKSPGEYTVFAPHDIAFNALLRQESNRIINDTDLIGSIVLSHIVKGRYLLEGLRNVDELLTLGGTFLQVSHDLDPAPKVNNVILRKANLQAQNGVIHVIDELLEAFPPQQEIEM